MAPTKGCWLWRLAELLLLGRRKRAQKEIFLPQHRQSPSDSESVASPPPHTIRHPAWFKERGAAGLCQKPGWIPFMSNTSGFFGRL